MAEFEITASVVPEIDQRKKRKVQKELDGMSGSLGTGSGGGGSSDSLNRLDSLVFMAEDRNDYLKQIRDGIATLTTQGIARSAERGGIRSVGSSLKKFITNPKGALADMISSLTLIGREDMDMARKMVTGPRAQRTGGRFQKMMDTSIEILDDIRTWVRMQATSGGFIGKMLSTLTTLVGGISLGSTGTALAGAGVGMLGVWGIQEAIKQHGGKRGRKIIRDRRNLDTSSISSLIIDAFETGLDPTGMFAFAGGIVADKITKAFRNLPNFIKEPANKFIDIIGRGIGVLMDPFGTIARNLDSTDFVGVARDLIAWKFPTVPAVVDSFTNIFSGKATLGLDIKISSQVSQLLNFIGLGGPGRSLGKGGANIGGMGAGTRPTINFDPEINVSFEIDADQLVDDIEKTIDDTVQNSLDEWEKNFGNNFV